LMLILFVLILFISFTYQTSTIHPDLVIISFWKSMYQRFYYEE
jgi:hypothetical protein